MARAISGRARQGVSQSSGRYSRECTYETLASFAMFAAWVFYGLAAAGVLVLRRRYSDRPRPYAMWGYPVTLWLFLAVAVGFVLNTLAATPGPALAASLIMAAGIPVYFVWNRK